MAPPPALIAAITVVVLLAGCTSSAPPPPSSATPTEAPSETSSPSVPTTTPTPTPSWSGDQAAAIRAVDEYRASSQKIGTRPSTFSEKQMSALLGKSAGPDVVKANVASFLALKKKGFRYEGTTSEVSTKATDASDVGYAVEVVVTRCTDQSGLRVVDESGNQVDEGELGFSVPKFNLRQYTLQKRTKDEAFLVYGLAPAKGQCGP